MDQCNTRNSSGDITLNIQFNTAITLLHRTLHCSVQLDHSTNEWRWGAGEGEYAEAAVAYEAAGELDSVVRLSLDQLKSPHKAAAIVRKAGSRDAAQRLAQYCLAARDYQVPCVMLMPSTWSCTAFGSALPCCSELPGVMSTSVSVPQVCFGQYFRQV